MDYRASTQQNVKIDNQKIILQLLLEQGPMSRADLAKTMKSSKPTISKNVEHLLADRRLIEIGKDDNMYGKKGILLDVNPDYAHILAIDLSKNLLRVAVSNLRGEIIHYTKIAIEDMLLGNTTDYDVTNCIDDFFEEEKVNTEKIVQTVIAFPGVVTNNEFYLTNVKNKEIVLKQLKPYVTDKLATELLIKNDINLAVLAEKKFGPYTEEANLYLMSCDIGVGVGIIIDHQLYEGDRNAAGEVGFILPSTTRDGKFVVLEDKISLYVILDRYMKASGNKVDFDGFIQKISQADKDALELYDDIVTDICVSITNMATVLDIKHVVVTGRIFDLHINMIDEMNQRMKDMTPFDTHVVMTTINKMSLKGAIILGTGEVVQRMV